MPKIICRECNSRNVKIEQMTLNCSSCGAVYDLSQGERETNQISDGFAILQPKSLQIERSHQLYITKSWLSDGKLAMILALLMFGGWSIYFAFQRQYFLITIVVILFGLNMLCYAFVYGAANLTEIKINDDELIVENSIQIWKNKQLKTKNIDQLYCKQLRNYDWQHFWGSRYKYDVWVITKDGHNVNLISSLLASTEALYIEQEIEQYLGIKDRFVPGEYKN